LYLTNKPGSRYIVLDIEANGLKPDKLWCLVWKELGVGGLHKVVGHEAVTDFWRGITRDRNTVVVGHNAISYDVPVLNRLSGSTLPTDLIVDTQVLGFLYYPKLADGHSLAAYGHRFGMLKVGADIEDWSSFSHAMLERCVRDVEITERLLITLRRKMNERQFSEFSCWIEHFTREAVDRQEEVGFYFDKVAGRRLHTYLWTLARASYPQVQQEGDELVCYDYVQFNLGSPAQRVARMEAIGYKAINFTKKTKKGRGGNPQVDEDGLNAFLEECDEKVKPAVQAMSKWLVAHSRGNMVLTWLNSVAADGAIHGTVWTCGAGSRRCTHTGPNTANIPSGEAPYGTACRRLWRARAGRVLVGCDAKAVQMRMFAARLGNVEVGMQYVEGDPHQRNADAAGIPRKKVKNCFYAMIFGAQDPKLGKTGLGGTGTPAQGAAIRQALYQTTPGLEALFEAAEASYNENDGWMQLMDGGWVRCPSPHSALNYWIQGDEAVLMKLTVIWVRKAIKNLGLDAFQVGFIHDEVQYDCHPDVAEEVAELFKRAIAKAGERLKFIIPMAGDSKTGPTWAETH